MTQTKVHTLRPWVGASLEKWFGTAPSRSRQLWLTGLMAAVLAGFLGKAMAQTPVPTATNLWVLKLGNDGSSCSSPAIAPDGTIYQATYEGILLAVTPGGRIHWKFDTGTEIEIKSSPAIADDGTIYFGSRNRKFYAVTPAGKLKWTFATGAWVDSSPAIATDGTLYFGSWDKNFYALDPAGVQKWKLAVGAILVSSPAIAADGTIYFGAMDKNIYALSPDGMVKWKFSTGGEIVSSPAIGNDGIIYVTSTDGNLYAIKPDGGKLWNFHMGSFNESSPVLDENGNIFVAGNDEYCISKDGQGHTLSGLACQVDVSAVCVAGRMYWSRPWRTLQAVNLKGEVIWSADTDVNVSASPVTASDGTVYATCGRLLYAIQPAGEAPLLAKSPWPMFHADPRHTGRVPKPTDR